jgi:hypothetical protein
MRCEDCGNMYPSRIGDGPWLCTGCRVSRAREEGRKAGIEEERGAAYRWIRHDAGLGLAPTAAKDLADRFLGDRLRGLLGRDDDRPGGRPQRSNEGEVMGDAFHEADVAPLYDDGDEITEMFARGHVDRAAFVAAVNREWAHLSGGDPFVEADVEHEWRRAVPDPRGDKTCIYHPAAPRSRGAFKATIIDVNYPASSRAPRETATDRGSDGGGA